MSAMPTTAAGPSGRLPANDVLYEVVNGEHVELPPMGVYESGISSDLGGFITAHARARKLGRSRIETLFRLVAAGGVERRPDVAYVSYERWAKDRRIPTANAWEVTPNLAVEVISPSNTADEIQTKLHEYFRAGVELVWVIYPREQEVYVYTAPTQVTILDRMGELDGGNVLPGFKLPVAALFEDELEPEPQEAERSR
jgi:Uma2 family endonuclease